MHHVLAKKITCGEPVLETALLQAKQPPAEGCPQLTASRVLSLLTPLVTHLPLQCSSFILSLLRGKSLFIIAPVVISLYFVQVDNAW